MHVVISVPITAAEMERRNVNDSWAEAIPDVALDAKK
jgi:hypothetical protein